MRVRCATDDRWFDSAEEAACEYGVAASTIKRACKQPGLKAGGKLFHGDYGETYQKNFDDIFIVNQTERREFSQKRNWRPTVREHKPFSTSGESN